MKKTLLCMVIAVFPTASASPQLIQSELNHGMAISTIQYLRLWLDVMSVELSTGVFAPEDMGEAGCRVRLYINSDNKIEFDLFTDYDTSLTEELNV